MESGNETIGTLAILSAAWCSEVHVPFKYNIIIIIILLVIHYALFTNPAGTYYITNAKWGSSICASANNNGEVYLQAPNDWAYCKWQLLQDYKYPMYYYILDIQRNKYLFSGYEHDGKVYEGDFDSSNGDHFRWKLEVIANSVFDPDNPQQSIIIQSLCLTDRAFGKAIIGGTDGKILFTDPDSTNVLASRWSLVLISL